MREYYYLTDGGNTKEQYSLVGDERGMRRGGRELGMWQT